ncbi:MAG TPA: glycosyltransferase [Vicinamibacterales bacterium]
MSTLTVIVPTYNRATSLARALRPLVAQATRVGGVRVMVVDNNSTDQTRAVIAQMGSAVDYVFEQKQGLSYARNAGIIRATTDLVAFTDDDVEAADDWMEVILREFDQHPDVDCVGGRVLPCWHGEPPAWLTREHWAPLALQDHGEFPREFDRAHPVCLVGANVAFRRSVFDNIGLFATGVQRVRDGIGSTEDHELLQRLYDDGGRARYVPEMLVTTNVPDDRLTAAYHRRWHVGHGRFHALMRLPDMERSSRGRLLGVPAHLYRTAIADLGSWIALRLRGERARAFAAETRLCFFGGFLRERCPLPRR